MGKMGQRALLRVIILLCRPHAAAMVKKIEYCACPHCYNSHFYISKIQHEVVTYNTIQYNTIQYNTIQYHTIQYNTIPYNTIQYNTIQYHTIQYHTMQYIDNITWCFQYPPWYLAEVPSIFPRPKAEGKYGTEAKYRADTENTR